MLITGWTQIMKHHIEQEISNLEFKNYFTNLDFSNKYNGDRKVFEAYVKFWKDELGYTLIISHRRR